MADIEVIRLPTRFDYAAHRTFTDAYTLLLSNLEVKELVLDFTHVEYLDSSALGMMVLLQKRFKEKNKKVKVRGARGATFDILKMANMNKIFEFI